MPWLTVRPRQFGKVFVINLKDRTDKLDAFTLAASLTGFDVDVIEGVRGVDIALKAMPPNKVPENVSVPRPDGGNRN